MNVIRQCWDGRHWLCWNTLDSKFEVLWDIWDHRSVHAPGTTHCTPLDMPFFLQAEMCEHFIPILRLETAAVWLSFRLDVGHELLTTLLDWMLKWTASIAFVIKSHYSSCIVSTVFYAYCNWDSSCPNCVAYLLQTATASESRIKFPAVHQ